MNSAYATHPYDYDGKQAANWDAAFGYLVASHPVVMTEFGQYYFFLVYLLGSLNRERYCATDNYVSDLLAYAQSKGVHWTAWAWFVSGCAFPSIIADWNGTPISGAGELVKAALAGSVPSTGSSSTSSTSTTAPTSAPSGPTTPASMFPLLFNLRF